MNRNTYNKKHMTYTLTDIQKLYQRDRREWPYKVSPRVFMRVARRILYLISLAMIRENYVFNPPGQIGRFGVVKRKHTKTYYTDYDAIRKTGKPAKHLNRHSNWCYFRFVWRTKRIGYAGFTNKGLYAFAPVRDEKRREIGKRGLAQWIKSKAEDPYEKNYDALAEI